MKKLSLIIAILVLVTIAFCVICYLFDTSFAEATIDWFAFGAGLFLVVEGLYAMKKHGGPFLPDQLLRLFRVLIGTCVFTIHLLQFMRI